MILPAFCALAGFSGLDVSLRSDGPEAKAVSLGGPVPTGRDRPCRHQIGRSLPPLADLGRRSVGRPYFPLPT
jgi:hypothetical protein